MHQLNTIVTALLLMVITLPGSGFAQDADQSSAPPARKYRLTDPELKVVQIDSSPNESFLSIRADSMGRLFVGGREALFVYEPDDKGGYKPRQELYRFPDHSWVYDIEIRGHDVYVLTMSALYLFEGAVTKREGLTPKKLIWGCPDWHVHQAFHGLAWGPEGDLYISMGDLLVFYGDFNRPDHWGHWTFFCQPEGTRVPYTGVGGIFRCKPDGSNLQVVATGTRNSCGLVFDSHWNLFTNDNDHEGLPTEYVPGRILHVTPHADFGWPRGWLPSITPDRKDLLDTVVADMGRAVPVGMTYYDEEFLPEKYRNNLLLARWGNRTISRYPLEKRGASFKADEHVLLEGLDTTRPVGVAVGRGGRIFATLSYMAHNEGSPVYPSDLIMITKTDDSDSHPFEAVDLTTADDETLSKQLVCASSWPGRRAHSEMMRRDRGSRKRILEQQFASPDLRNEKLLTRLVWWSGSVKAGMPLDTEELGNWKFLFERDMNGSGIEFKTQALRALSEYSVNDPMLPVVFAFAMARGEPSSQLAAVCGWFELTAAAFEDSDRRSQSGITPFSLGPVPSELYRGPARSDDTYLRQAATLLLARKGTLEMLGKLCQSDDVKTRLAGVLASGFRLTLPEPTKPLDEKLPLQPYPNEDAYVVEYADGKVDLRDHGRVGLFTMAEHWKAAEHTAEQEALFALLLARLDDSDVAVRLQAAHFLSLLRDDRSEAKIAAVRSQTERDRLVRAPIDSPTELWIAGPFDDHGKGFATVHPPEAGAIDLGAKYESAVGWQKLKRGDRLFNFREQFGDTAGKSAYAFFRLDSPRAQQVLLLPGSDDGIRIWNNGRLVHDNDVERGGLPLQDVVFVDLQPGSNDILIRVRNIADEHVLYLHYRSIERSVKLSLPEKFDEAGLAERLRSASSDPNAKVPAALLEVDWEQALKGADIDRGRKLFSADGIGCAKCHSISQDTPVQGGPSLEGAGRRFTLPYLVESVLLPSRQLSPVFKSTIVTTTEGKVHSGLAINETAESLELLTPEAKRVKLNKPEIEDRREQDLSPMPAGLIRKPDELRDILAWLLSQSS